MKFKFDKYGLVPLIVQDANCGRVLSVFYANEKAIEKMKETGYVWRYSRSKQKLMMKGGESGNIQKIVSMEADCDCDALLARVSPKGPACHKGKNSCFDSNGGLRQEYDFAVLKELVETLKERKKNPSTASYTSSIINDKRLIIEKLREECEELISGKTAKNLEWEAADLLYFILVYLENRKIPLTKVLKELRRRRNLKK